MVKRVKAKTNGHAKPGHNSGNRGSLRLYRSYNFVDKDPAIDQLRTAMEDEGIDARKLHILSNVGQTTIDNWMEGKTKSPQHRTLAAAAASMGFDWTLKRAKRMDYEKEMASAARWHERHHTELKK